MYLSVIYPIFISTLLLINVTITSHASTALLTGASIKNEVDEAKLPPGITPEDNAKSIIGFEWQSPKSAKSKHQLKARAIIETGFSGSKQKIHTQFEAFRMTRLNESWRNRTRFTFNHINDEFMPKDSIQGIGVRSDFALLNDNAVTHRFSTLLISETHDDFVMPYKVDKLGMAWSYIFNQQRHAPFWMIKMSYIDNSSSDLIWKNQETALELAYRGWKLSGFKGGVSLRFVEKQFEVDLPPPPPAGSAPILPPPLPIFGTVSSNDLLETRRSLNFKVQKKLSNSVSLLWLSRFEKHKDKRADLDMDEYRHQLQLRWMF